MVSFVPSGVSTTSRRETRPGRPTRASQGEVEERILDAARRVFVERGLEGASIDQIAEVARAGKPSIYARFQGKEALFAAVIERAVREINSETYGSTGGALEENLASLGRAMLRKRLTPEVIALIRLSIAEAVRFPDCASAVARMARDQSREPVVAVLTEAAESFHQLAALSPDSAARLRKAAQKFIDLVISPLLLRALQGENLEALGAEIDAHVADSVPFFLAGCGG